MTSAFYSTKLGARTKGTALSRDHDCELVAVELLLSVHDMANFGCSLVTVSGLQVL